MLDNLTAKCIVARGANAASVECECCDAGHVEDVTTVPNRDGTLRFYIRCPENGRAIVHPERLFRWTVNLDALVGVAAETIGCTGAAIGLVSGRVWDIGRLVRGNTARNVIVARGLSWPDGRKIVVDSRKVAIANPPLVLAIGRLPADDVWGKKAPIVVALPQLLVLNGEAAMREAILDAALANCKPGKPERKDRRGDRRAKNIGALMEAMREHIRAAQDQIHTARQLGRVPKLLPRPTMSDLASQINVTGSTVTRCLEGKNAKQLRMYWDAAADIDQIMKIRL